MIKFDLHIHSYASNYKEGKSIVDESTIENAEVLMAKLNEQCVGLFSITDHNRFWPELYTRFDALISSGKYPNVKGLVAGVEFDVQMDPEMDKCHIITILSEDVDIKYLAYLQKIGVSFIFAGEKNIDLKIALKKLKDLFGIEKIICEGGPTTTQSLLNENLVDKLIILKHPCIAQPGSLSVFGNANLSSWSLESFQMLSDKQHLLFIYNKK